MTADLDLSIVILSWNTRDLLRACLTSVLRRDHGLSLEVIVVDNASADDSVEMVQSEFPEARLIRNDENKGYAGGNNQGLEAARAPFLLLLNSDTEIRGSALRDLVDFLRQHPTHGAVAPRLVSPDGSVQNSCMRFPDLKVGFLYDSLIDRMMGKTEAVRHYFMADFDHLHSIDVDQPPGAAFLLKREVYAKIGGLDEDLFLFFNDVDFCRRVVEAGYRIRYLAEAEVLHHIGKSTSKFPDFVKVWNINRVRYYRKHHGWWGATVVKSAIFLRGVEESWKVLWRAPFGTRWPALKDLCRILSAAMKA